MSILSAIRSAIKGAFAFIWETLLLPGRLLGCLLGGSMAPLPSGDSPLVRDLKTELAGRQASLDNHQKIAKAVHNWCVDSIIENKPAAVPCWLPRDVKGWLRGLTRDECECVIPADKEAISAHVRRLFPLKGLRAVQPLAPAEWPAEPVWKDPAPRFVQYASIAKPAA